MNGSPVIMDNKVIGMSLLYSDENTILYTRITNDIKTFIRENQDKVWRVSGCMTACV